MESTAPAMTITILAVDDSASIRQMVSLTTTGAGHRCVTATNGAEALALAQNTPIDLVLTDQNMPVMDGLTLVRSLRAIPRFSSIPILVLTTETGEEMRARGRSAGATGWLTKPFDPATLLAVIDRVTARRVA
jgi:two-component system chemotaxis response regulator CheY